jgi:hypothetical protein
MSDRPLMNAIYESHKQKFFILFGGLLSEDIFVNSILKILKNVRLITNKLLSEGNLFFKENLINFS